MCVCVVVVPLMAVVKCIHLGISPPTAKLHSCQRPRREKKEKKNRNPLVNVFLFIKQCIPNEATQLSPSFSVPSLTYHHGWSAYIDTTYIYPAPELNIGRNEWVNWRDCEKCKIPNPSFFVRIKLYRVEVLHKLPILCVLQRRPRRPTQTLPAMVSVHVSSAVVSYLPAEIRPFRFQSGRRPGGGIMCTKLG